MIRLLLAALAATTLALPARAQIVDVQQVTSPGGIDAWLVESHEIPFVALDIRFMGGASLDPEGERGAINLMTGLLEEGAGEMDSQAFAAARDRLAARFDFRASDDAVTVSARMLTENRDKAAGLLRKALVAPRFDHRAVERVKEQVLSAIRSDREDPAAIAHRRFDSMAFDGHPYGSPIEGTPESVKGLSPADLDGVKDRVLARDRVVVGAAGDITADQLGRLLDRILGDLPAEGAPMPSDAPYRLDGGVTVVSFDTPQSVAVFGQQGIERDDEDFFPAYVLNTILGHHGFNARLMEEVREKRGLTYGVATYLLPKDYAALLLGQVSSANDTIAEAVSVIRDQWRRLAENGVTEDELAAAKTYLTGAYPLRFDGNGPIAGILAGMQAEGLKPSYIETRNDRIRAVTKAGVDRVAGELLTPDALHFVVVGKPEGLPAASN